jgi:hypothetical protein
MKEDPPMDAKCRDKFLVQSVAITPERDLGSITAIVCMFLSFDVSLLNLEAVAKRRKYRKGSSGREEDSSRILACG